MAYARETGVMKAIKTLIFFTLLSTCWGQLGGVQDPQYHNAVSFPYGGGSSPDIELNNGTKIDPCRSQRIYPCFTYDSEAKLVDIRSNHCEDLMQLKIFGTPINASREQICCGYSLAGNLTNDVSCPDTMNDTRLYFGDPDCFSIHLSYILAIVISYVGYNGIFFFLIIFIIYLLCKNRSPAEERDATVVLEFGTYQQLRRSTCCTALTDLFNGVCFCNTPNQPWKCRCDKPCLIPKPILLNCDGKSYVIFVIENEAEMFTCVNPHLDKYQQYFHAANVFVVYMDDVDAATSAKYLPVWYKESGKWDRSVLKDKVFLSTPVSHPSLRGNSTSYVMGNGGAIQGLTKMLEVQNPVLVDAPVQMNLVEPQSPEYKEGGSPVHGITRRRSFSLVGSTSVSRMGAGGIALETVEERKEFKGRSPSYNALTTPEPVLKDKDAEPTYTPMRAST